MFARLGSGAIPFLVPLMLQVGMGFSALFAGLMMIPLALGSLLGKSAVERVLHRLGFRLTLLWVTGIIGVMIGLFALISPEVSLWFAVALLLGLGVVRATQFTAMNTITLGDLSDDDASSGNSVLAVTQQLSISFGVAICASALHFYTRYTPGSLMDHFHLTFLTMGALTLLSALAFLYLKKSDGQHLVAD